METQESDLIDRCRQADTEIYAELVERYKQALYRHCFAMVRDEDVAEDIAQETFITAYYALSKFDANKAKFSTWLFKIATNKALNWLKREAKHIAADDSLIAQIASQQPEPAEQAIHRELHEAVVRLRPKYRAVVSLYYWQGLAYSDIAAVLGAPEGSVKGWMKRAKQDLRKELA